MYGFINKANTNNKIATAPNINTNEDKPSLNNTKTNEQKTKAEPVSFCSNTNPIGKATTPIGIKPCEVVEVLRVADSKDLEHAKELKIKEKDFEIELYESI